MVRQIRWFFYGILAVLTLLESSCNAISSTQPGNKHQNPPTNNPASQIENSPSTNTPFQPLVAGTEAFPDTELGLPSPDVLAAKVSETAPARGANEPTPESIPATPTETTALEDITNPPLTAASHVIWIDPLLPVALRGNVHLPPQMSAVGMPEEASLRLEYGDERPVANWVYALAAPFPTIPQGVSFETVSRAWHGETGEPFSNKPLLMDESTFQGLSKSWGEPAPQAVQVLDTEVLLDHAWNTQPSWAIIPFETLEPRWKVLEIDGMSPIQKGFEPAAYPLTVSVSLNGEPALAEATRLVYGETLLPTSNRDPERLTVLAMTGVTALVRATAFAMERRGIHYPAQDIGPWLREADLTHISNEVPFAEDCPYPNPLQPDMRFCSHPRYIGLLETVGTDIVELTGDHFQDWGAKAMKLTLKLYQERGWLYFGGGADLDEAQRAITLEHNGNRLAFIGCNAKGGSFAQAAVSRPGAAACNHAWMASEISRLRDQGYLPIATFQHYEYYTYKAQENQKRDFKRMAQAGAVIVSGSQAHQPQAMEFHSGALIHYGLGNLFFDQYDVSPATRQGFIDRHVFYNGRHISSELLTMQFVDYARPRPMTPQEQRDLLRTVFSASGW